MRTVTKLLVGLAFMLAATAALAGTATGLPAQAPAGHPASVHADSTTVPSGPNINVQQQEADAAQTKHKLVIGVVAAGLLVMVYFGHRQRAKSRVRKKNLQNARG